jgi:peptidoglycan hydrolase-like protein with peptidoglycan-binding domain
MPASPYDESKHRRGPGGLFAASSAAAGKPSGAWLSGPVRKGTGRRGSSDPRVIAAQKKLNALGITDERGRPLLVDGIDGNHTTAAIKKWQQANGMQPTGELDAKAMVALLSAKPKPKAATKMAARPPGRRSTKSRKSQPAAKPTARQQMNPHGQGFSRLGPNAGT